MSNLTRYVLPADKAAIDDWRERERARQERCRAILLGSFILRADFRPYVLRGKKRFDVLVLRLEGEAEFVAKIHARRRIEVTSVRWPSEVRTWLDGPAIEFCEPMGDVLPLAVAVANEGLRVAHATGRAA